MGALGLDEAQHTAAQELGFDSTQRSTISHSKQPISHIPGESFFIGDAGQALRPCTHQRL